MRLSAKACATKWYNLPGPGKVRSEWTSGAATTGVQFPKLAGGSVGAHLNIRPPHRPCPRANFIDRHLVGGGVWRGVK